MAIWCEHNPNGLQEDFVVDSVIAVLQSDGATIVSRCPGRERGYDIDAKLKDGRRLLVEAKGNRTACDNVISQQQRNAYTSHAVSKALMLWSETDGPEVAIALPTDHVLLQEIAKTRLALDTLGISLLWVRSDGSIDAEWRSRHPAKSAVTA